MDLIRFIPFRVEIISGREYGERENTRWKHRYPDDPRPYYPDGQGEWPLDDQFTGAIGTVVGAADFCGGGVLHYLVCFRGAIPMWYREEWLKVR